MMERVAIYYRVSTDKQDLESQKHAVTQWLEQNPRKPRKIFIIEDEGFSGKDHRRPGLKKVMDMAMQKEIDTIIVYRLDRFSRDASMAIRTILELDHFGVAFISITQPVLNLGHDMPFRRTLLAAFAEIAELERETIIARVKAGLDAARKRGAKFGAPSKWTPENRENARYLRSQGHSYKKIAQALELSVGSVHAMLKSESL